MSFGVGKFKKVHISLGQINSYGSQIQQELRWDRVVTTSAVPSNLGDEDIPF